MFLKLKPVALAQSTEQLLQTKSTNLYKIRPDNTSLDNPINPVNFMVHDYYNMYKSSYGAMSSRVFNGNNELGA